MVKPATQVTLDLAASSRRVATARSIAAHQARIVETAGTRLDRLNIDLLFLSQETVLVLDETHRLLVALSAKDRSADADDGLKLASTEPPLKRRPSRRIALAVQAFVLALLAAFAVEIIDPAPMDVFAFHANVPVLGP